MPTFPPLAQSGQIDPNDLGNGFYNHIRHVGPSDPEFLDIVAWLISRGAPKDVILKSDPTLNPVDSRQWSASYLEFSEPEVIQAFKNEGTERKTYQLDASQAFNYPDNALIGLKVFFGFGDPTVRKMYPGLRQPVQYISVSPIGAPWSELTNVYEKPCFHGSGADNGNTYPEDTVYTDSSGAYKKTARKWAFFNIEPVWVKVG